jgi:hypothetical protein
MDKQEAWCGLYLFAVEPPLALVCMSSTCDEKPNLQTYVVVIDKAKKGSCETLQLLIPN